MANTKNTKRALIASVLSIVLCFAMLIGSTFAWFTDTASTGVNVIKSGNLEIGFEYADGKNDPSTTAWTNAENAKIFNYEKWEPGYTVAKHIKISNKGSLALKYQLKFMLSGEIGKLSEVIDVYFADPAQQVADRTDIANLKAVGTLKEFLMGSEIKPESGELLEGEADVVTIVLKMRESANNDYQNQSVGEGLTIAVLATQYTDESDSFDNKYDIGATYPIVAEPLNVTMQEVSTYGAGEQATDVVVTSSDGSVKVTVPAANYDTTTAAKYTTKVDVNLAGSSADSTTYDINVSVTDANGNSVTLSAPATVEWDLVAGLQNVKVTHNGDEMTSVADNAFTADQQYSYNSSTGKLTIYSKTYSPFKVNYDTNFQASVNGVGYLSLREALYYAKSGDTVVLQKNWGYNYSTSYALAVIADDVTLDLNGYYIASQNSYVLLTQKADNFTIKNGTVKVLGQNGNAFGIACQGGSANIEDVTIEVLAPNTVTYNYATAMRAANQAGYETITGTYNNVTIKEVKNASSVGYTVGVVAQGASIADAENLYTDSSTVILNNCDIDVSGFAIAGNGSYHGTRVDVNGGSLRSTTTAIYHPQYGTLNLSKCAISGYESGIEIRAGKLNMTSGSVSGNADPFVGEGNDSGLTMFGAAIAVSQHTTEKPITVTINGGTLTGLYAIYEDDLVTGQSEKSKDVAIILNGGTFNGEIYTANNKIIDSRQNETT